MKEFTSPKEALSSVNASDICSETFDDRTTNVALDNRTRATVAIAMAQCLDESNAIPPGFAKDTGVFVVDVNGAPGSRIDADPCRAGGRNMPIQATRIKLSAKLSYGNAEKDFHFDDAVAPAGEYLSEVIFGIDPALLAQLFPTMPIDMNVTKKKN